MKYLSKFFFLLLVCQAYLQADEIEGLWQSFDDTTGKRECIVAIYKYNHKHFGRIVATCDESGNIDETLEKPLKKAPGVVGNPYYCGLDFIYNLVPLKRCKQTINCPYNGKVIDPEKGKSYSATIWIDEKGECTLRGRLMVFWRDKVWLPFHEQDFPPNFLKPDFTTFIPNIPKLQSH